MKAAGHKKILPQPNDSKTQDLNGFLRAQRLAYESVIAIGKELQEGWTEIQAAQLIATYLKDSGVRSFFHEPFAWFGERTRFEGFTKYRHYYPGPRRLRPTDVVILDVAPILDGYVGDIGYTTSLVRSLPLAKAMDFLRKLRAELPPLFEKHAQDGGRIWAEIDSKIHAQGYDNIHQMYPFSVLGHRVHRLPFSRFAAKTPVPFSLHAFVSVLARGVYPELLTKKHRGDLYGLWAIEPHLGGKGFGAKFEEILVVTPDGASWLDDQVPHLK